MRIRACVIMTKGSQILLGRYRHDGEDHFVAYGGGVDDGESAIMAGVREIKEELGIDLEEPTFLGVIDNIFLAKENSIRELGIYFKCDISNIKEIHSIDQVVEPVWIHLKDIERYNIHPKTMKKLIAGNLPDYFLAGELAK